MEKKDEYYASQRNEIIDLIDCNENSIVLDVGCGSGGLGKHLKAKGCGLVYGIEIIEKAALRAKEIYDEVFIENVDEFIMPFEDDYFDFIVCADVIEHLKDPWQFLLKIKKHLKPGGLIIGSIPNIRHRVIISELLRGNFDYKESGIMDNTHLRFFTFNTIIKLFTETGYKIIDIGPVIDPVAEDVIKSWNDNQVKGRIKDLVRLFTNMDYDATDDDLRDLFTVQFLLRAVKE